MARTLRWVEGLPVVARKPLTGPRAVGAAATESTTGYVQTVASPFGAWRMQLDIAPLRRRMYSDYEGMVTALNGGANAVRAPMPNIDGLTFAEAGTTVTQAEIRAGEDWDETAWDNGIAWGFSRPFVAVAAAAAAGATVISLADAYWGHALWRGTWLGVLPFHFGLYKITEVQAPGRYRVWPPLRKAIATTDYATLEPTLAMRLESESAALPQAREPRAAQTMTLVEVPDPDVRHFFAG